MEEVDGKMYKMQWAVLSQRTTLLWKLLESGKHAWMWQTGSKTHSGNAEVINSGWQMAMDSFFVSFFFRQRPDQL